jgi:hypothetical protein
VFAKQIVDCFGKQSFDPSMIDRQQFQLPVRLGTQRNGHLLLSARVAA